MQLDEIALRLTEVMLDNDKLPVDNKRTDRIVEEYFKIFDALNKESKKRLFV
jgi:hypothetical protein